MRAETIDMLTNTKSSKSQKRNNFKLKGVSRAIVDELEILAETCAYTDTHRTLTPADFMQTIRWMRL